MACVSDAQAVVDSTARAASFTTAVVRAGCGRSDITRVGELAPSLKLGYFTRTAAFTRSDYLCQAYCRAPGQMG